MNFATLQGLTIPEGVVTQIADASGRVLWAVSGGKAVLQVQKVIANVYSAAALTTYENEEFILLSITIKGGGTVNVSYGGLTKTLSNSSTIDSAQSVYFGTFSGASDSVVTPASGELTIEGDCTAFALGTYNVTKSATSTCTCVVSIDNFGSAETIPNYAFAGTNGSNDALTSATIGTGIKSIGMYAFHNCRNLNSVPFENISGWYVTKTENGDISTGTAVDVSDPVNNATLLRTTYVSYFWYCF